MTIFKDYDAKGNFMAQRDEPISIVNIERALKEHGADYNKGYLDAMKDFLEEMNLVITRQKPTGSYDETPAMIKTKLKNYIAHKCDLLTILSEVVKEYPADTLNI